MSTAKQLNSQCSCEHQPELVPCVNWNTAFFNVQVSMFPFRFSHCIHWNSHILLKLWCSGGLLQHPQFKPMLCVILQAHSTQTLSVNCWNSDCSTLCTECVDSHISCWKHLQQIAETFQQLAETEKLFLVLWDTLFRGWCFHTNTTVTVTPRSATDWGRVENRIPTSFTSHQGISLSVTSKRRRHSLTSATHASEQSNVDSWLCVWCKEGRWWMWWFANPGGGLLLLFGA